MTNAHKNPKLFRLLDSHTFYILCILLSVLVFFKDGIFFDSQTLLWDSMDQMSPDMYFMGNMYRNLELPLWNPYLFNGYPAYANIQSQNFYPINFLFLLFTDFTAKAVYLQLVLHFFLGALFMYLLCFYYLKDKGAALAGALVFTYCGYRIGHFQHLTVIDTIIWLPLLVYFLERMLVERKILFMALGSLTFGVMLLAGHPQSAHFIGFYITAHFIYRVYGIYIKNKNINQVKEAALNMFLFFFLGTLLAMVQLLPTYEMTKLSARSTFLSFSGSISGGQVYLNELMTFLVPDFFGALTREPYIGSADISSNIIYLTVPGFVCLIFAVLNFYKDKDFRFFFCGTIFALLVSLGSGGFLYLLLWKFLPAFDLFRSPAILFFLFSFLVSLLIAYGYSHICKNEITNKEIGTVLVIFLALFSLFYFTSHESVNPSYRLFLVFTFLTFLIIFLKHNMDKRAVPFLLLLIFIDPYTVYSGNVLFGNNFSHSRLDSQPPMLDVLSNYLKRPSRGLEDLTFTNEELKSSNKYFFRIHPYPANKEVLSKLSYNNPLKYKYYLTHGLEPIVLQSQKDILSLATSDAVKFAHLTSTKIFIELDNLSHPESTFFEGSNGFFHMVSSARFFKDDSKMLSVIKSDSFEPESEVYISSSEDLDSVPFNRSFKWDTRILEYSPNKVTVEIDSNDSGYLVFSDTFYKGWKVFIDDKENALLKANYNFKAVKTPKGKHRISFLFSPNTFFFGLGLTVLAFSIILATIFYHFNYKGRESAV